MRLPALAFLSLTCWMTSAPARADDKTVLRCRVLKDDSTRLSCYDAIPVGAAATSGTRAPAAISANSISAPSLQGAFGMPEAPSSGIKFMDSQVNGHFQGWNPAQLIELANGQVWRITDGSRAYFDATNPKVRIERGLFGAFYMAISGTNQTPRVQRVK